MAQRWVPEGNYLVSVTGLAARGPISGDLDIVCTLYQGLTVLWSGQLFNGEQEDMTLSLTELAHVGPASSLTVGCYGWQDDGN